MTQAELAASAGITQSAISAYESGHRQPSVPMLAALIEAIGNELVLTVRRRPGQLARLTGPLGRRVRSHRRDLITAAAGHGITHLRVFGTVARGSDRPDSDVDLLVGLPAGMSLFRLGRAQDELETILGTPVDLLPASDLKPRVRSRVERELIAL
jgi:uncharacterized protein